MERLEALRLFLNVEEEEINDYIEESSWSNTCFYYGKEEYLVLTEEESYEEVTQHIIQTLWAFRPSFLANKTGLSEVIFSKLSDLFEESNEAILELINATCGIEEFVDDAIRHDGVGHFLALYDGNENEEEVNNTTYYIYRTN